MATPPHFLRKFNGRVGPRSHSAKTLTFKSNAKFRRRTARRAARAFLMVTARPESIRTNGPRAPCSGRQAVGQRVTFSAHPMFFALSSIAYGDNSRPRPVAGQGAGFLLPAFPARPYLRHFSRKSPYERSYRVGNLK